MIFLEGRILLPFLGIWCTLRNLARKLKRKTGRDEACDNIIVIETVSKDDRAVSQLETPHAHSAISGLTIDVQNLVRLQSSFHLFDLLYHCIGILLRHRRNRELGHIKRFMVCFRRFLYCLQVQRDGVALDSVV